MTFDSDYAMETPSEAYRRAREERKAKEDAEHAALNALLEQGKSFKLQFYPADHKLINLQ